MYTGLVLKLSALLPLPFLALGLVWGGNWAFVALFYLSIFAFLADESLFANGDTTAHLGATDRALADVVPVILGAAHLVLLPFAVLTLASDRHDLFENVLIFVSFALFFGTISTANAHELIHRPDRFRRNLGKWVFISLLFGHHVSAHLAIHHRHVATPQDPNSAPLNLGFYRFFNRAWRGSFRAGLTAETSRLKHAGKPNYHLSNPYIIYAAGAVGFLLLAYTLAGFRGVVVYLGYATLAQAQLLLSDYVQHYGIERRLLPDGKYEAVTIFHSWNAPHVFTSALMLNAPRHSDHHAQPSIRYCDLRTRASEGAPVLPYSIPVMSCIALFPNIWRRMMNPRVSDWYRQHDADHGGLGPTRQNIPV